MQEVIGSNPIISTTISRKHLNPEACGIFCFVLADDVCVFDFTKNKKGETSVNTIELGLDGNLTHPISAGWMSAVITKEDRLRLKRFSRLD
jgi:hypothetical protein